MSSPLKSPDSLTNMMVFQYPLLQVLLRQLKYSDLQQLLELKVVAFVILGQKLDNFVSTSGK